MKFKKQFRAYDIYRTYRLNEPSHIYGITDYRLDDYGTGINVTFYERSTGQQYIHYWTINTEDQIKACVKDINNILRNCRKPGKKRKYLHFEEAITDVIQ